MTTPAILALAIGCPALAWCIAWWDINRRKTPKALDHDARITVVETALKNALQETRAMLAAMSSDVAKLKQTKDGEAVQAAMRPKSRFGGITR